MKELIKIEKEASNFIKDLPLKTVEYKGVRVINAYDIARLHEKEVRVINQQFERVREKLCQNVDYFLVSREEFPESLFATQTFLPNNVKVLRLFTERGYLKLCKTFNDKLSWQVQDALVDSYFAKTSSSLKENLLYSIIRAKDDVGRALALNDYERSYVTPLENKVEEQAKELQTKAKEIEVKTQALVEAKPKVEFYDTVVMTTDTVDLGEVAKLLNFKDVGRNTLYKLLREWKVLAPDNQPYQKYVNAKCFKLVQYTVPGPYGRAKVKYKTVCYQKGLDLILRLLTKKGYERLCGACTNPLKVRLRIF